MRNRRKRWKEGTLGDLEGFGKFVTWVAFLVLLESALPELLRITGEASLSQQGDKTKRDLKTIVCFSS